jgi:signal transduction histidine kinase/FixJ family two-component response regulator
MPSILVVDDEPNLTWTMAEFLRRQGYDAVTASDYDSAVEALGATRVDVAVVDIILPGKSGIELVKRISESDSYIPVLLITGQPNLERVPEILRAGACDYLPKPVVKADLIQAVSRALDLKRAADEKQQSNSEVRSRVRRLQSDLDERSSELDAASGMLQAVLDGSNEYAIFATNELGVISLVNRAASDLFKEPPADLIGRPARYLFADPARRNQDFLKSMIPADDARTRLGEADLCRGDGGAFRASLTATPIHPTAGQFRGHLVFVKALSLSRQVADSSGAEHLAAAEPESIAALGRAAAQIAHEVRNPLTGLRLYSAHLKSKMTDSPETGQIQLVDKIIGTLNHLSNVVERTLDFAKPADLKPARSDLRRVIEEALRLVETDLASKEIRVECAVPADGAPCHIDELYMRLAVINVILNAIQAMSSGGRLGVNLTSTGQVFTLLVEDTGCGIPVKQLGRVFEPFYSTKARGLGLGLPFTKNIIEQHQGTIVISSREGAGTRVTISLPAKDVLK